ncbi:MAG: glycine--tRNA ligase subunit beta [Cyanobacteria bacterium P01_H01_bin.15]
MPAFLFEVGTEELPADFVSDAIAQWLTRIPQSLQEHFLTPDKIEVFGTPRRLAVLLSGLPEQQADREEDVKGPPVKAAFKDGQPTKAAEGFARKQGVSLEDFEIRDTEKGEFIFVVKQISGRPTPEILQELCLDWWRSLEGRRFMRWSDGDLRFPRPVRWLISLFDDQVLPVTLTNGSETLSSDRLSRGHRVLHPDPIAIEQASQYVKKLQEASIWVDPAVRQSGILSAVEKAAAALGGTADVAPDLLAEVVNLVEFPSVVVGKFDQEFLSLPPEVIITVMVTHQRYFAVSKGESLLPNFIAISNGNPEKQALISAGNERVIRARLADAKFFYDADCQESLENFVPKLEAVTFQEDLGSVRAKVDRIGLVAQQITEQLELAVEQTTEIIRCSLLCKADLMTSMVYEFPELEGIMGEKYARVCGESDAVAQGIVEHYQPRGAEDALPETLTGQIVGISDRIDTLVSIFGLGLIPTGSSDPFALRRAANAIINITWHADLGINLAELVKTHCDRFVAEHPDKESPESALQEFLMLRLRTLLQDERKLDYDLVNAVLGEADAEYTTRALADLLDLRDRAEFLQSIRQNQQLDRIYETVNRSTRLAAKGDLATDVLEAARVVDSGLFQSPAESAFYEALVALLPKTQAAQASRDYIQLVAGLQEVAPTVGNFFDGPDSVLVMDPEPEIRRNRLNLLGVLRNHGRVLADFGPIVKP